MKNKFKLIPIILAILLILFISIFSFDTGSFLGNLIHLIPSFLLLISLILSLYFPKIGGSLFILLGLFSIYFFHTYRDLFVFFIVSIIPIIIGIFFLISFKQKNKKKR